MQLGIDREFNGLELSIMSERELFQSKSEWEEWSFGCLSKKELAWASDGDTLTVYMKVYFSFEDDSKPLEYLVQKLRDVDNDEDNDSEHREFTDVREAIACFEEFAKPVIDRFDAMDSIDVNPFKEGAL